MKETVPMSSPRIPRHRPAVIPLGRARWFEVTPLGVLRVAIVALVCFAVWALVVVGTAS